MMSTHHPRGSDGLRGSCAAARPRMSNRRILHPLDINHVVHVPVAIYLLWGYFDVELVDGTHLGVLQRSER
jgi:hypothetical protein